MLKAQEHEKAATPAVSDTSQNPPTEPAGEVTEMVIDSADDLPEIDISLDENELGEASVKEVLVLEEPTAKEVQGWYAADDWEKIIPHMAADNVIPLPKKDLLEFLDGQKAVQETNRKLVGENEKVKRELANKENEVEGLKQEMEGLVELRDLIAIAIEALKPLAIEKEEFAKYCHKDNNAFVNIKKVKEEGKDYFYEKTIIEGFAKLKFGENKRKYLEVELGKLTTPGLELLKKVKMDGFADIDLIKFIKVCLRSGIDAQPLADLIQYIGLEEYLERKFPKAVNNTPQ